MKNIVFDLGGVLFRRDPKKCTPDFIDFFAFVRFPQMPKFWEEYDRGTLSMEEVKELLCREKQVDRATCDRYVEEAILKQEEIRPTAELVADLKRAGYRLYVLSNMSREFIDFLRLKPVYRYFDGEVVSCEELTVKPEERIYRILLERYGLDPQETLFIDDRKANIEAAERLGIHGFLFDHADPEKSCLELRGKLLE
uniref:HAD family hydrolase n=1 Tax=Alistipes sp. TaxID=1872444 RepID=UPI0040571598